MSLFPRPDYAPLRLYDPGRTSIAVDLSDNTNLWGPHPAAVRVVREADDEMLCRYPSVYADELQQAVAHTYDVPADCVTTGAGSDDVMDSLFRAAARPGTTVRYPAPTFGMVGILARVNTLEAQPVSWSDVEARPEVLLEGDPALVYVCRPNNPTGWSMDRDRLLGLVELAEQNDGPVIAVDEAYADFADDSLIREAPGRTRLVVLRTMSKAYGLAGLRVGFGVSCREVTVEAEKSRGPFKVGHISTKAAAAALADLDGYVRETTRLVRENRARLVGELENRGFEVLPSNANFVLIRVTGDDVGAASDFSSLLRRLRQSGVAARAFPSLRDVGDSLRVTIGPWAMMERFLEALDEAVR